MAVSSRDLGKMGSHGFLVKSQDGHTLSAASARWKRSAEAMKCRAARFSKHRVAKDSAAATGASQDTVTLCCLVPGVWHHVTGPSQDMATLHHIAGLDCDRRAFRDNYVFALCYGMAQRLLESPEPQCIKKTLNQSVANNPRAMKSVTTCCTTRQGSEQPKGQKCKKYRQVGGRGELEAVPY